MMPTIKDVAEKAGVGIATVISQMISLRAGLRCLHNTDSSYRAVFFKAED